MKRSAATGVIILNYGDPADTLACLDGIEQSDDLDLDVVVVDNGPSDARHRALADAIGRRAETIATGSNLGYAAGNNIGIGRVLDRGVERVWILNPDTVVAPNTLTLLREHLVDVPDCGIVGPRILFPGKPARIWFDGGTVDRSTAETGHLNQGKDAERTPPRRLDVDYVTGASLLVRRSLIEDIGLLPEQYFLYYEETDWCLRAQRAGWRTMVRQDAVQWHHKRSSGALPQPYYLYYMVRNRLAFARDCLRVDGELAMRQLQATFVSGWRDRVTERAPEWLDSFECLIKRAEADAWAGVDGRNDDITNYPGPESRTDL